MRRSTRGGTEEYVVFKADKENKEEKRLTDFEEVRLELDQRLGERTGSKRKISSEEIQLEVFSPFFAFDLQIIDLPGFDNESNNAEQILDMNLSYMKNEDYIILLVNNAANDIDDEALELAARADVDPLGDRTIGVVTKIDLVTSATEKLKLSNILSNKVKPLKHGYIGVGNRSNADLKSTFRPRSNTHTGKALFRRNTMKQREERGSTRPALQSGNVGLDLLIMKISNIFTGRLASLLSMMKEEREDEVKWTKEEIDQLGVDEEGNVDDLMAKLMEMAINKVKISLKGINKKMESNKALPSHFSFSDVLKMEAIAASKTAQTKQNQQLFYDRVLVSLKKEAGLKDKMTPQRSILETGVAILTENYRVPFRDLLDDFVSNLTRTLVDDLETTLGSFPQFKALVQSVILEDLERNKVKTEEYLDLQIDIHKHFIDGETFTSHQFNKSFKSLQDLSDWEPAWEEQNPCHNSLETLEENQDYSLSCDSLPHTSHDFGDHILLKGTKKKSFGRRVTSAFRGIRLKVGRPDEEKRFAASLEEQLAMAHLQLCVNYMRSVEKSLVTEVPKIFIMMLVVKTVDFLNGGIQVLFSSNNNQLFSKRSRGSLLVFGSEGSSAQDSGRRSEGKVNLFQRPSSILILSLLIVICSSNQRLVARSEAEGARLALLEEKKTALEEVVSFIHICNFHFISSYVILI